MGGGNIRKVIRRITLNISPEMEKKCNYPNHYDLVSCENCGMLFADIGVTKEDVDNYYVNCNMYDNKSDVQKGVYNEVCELYYRAIEPYITKKSRIIDIGCGSGEFLRYLKDKGYENVYGMDPAKESVQKLEDSGIKGTVCSIYDEIPKELINSFDVVVCTFVFEHLLLPDICLKNMLRLMDTKGIFYIAVPAAEGYKDYLREEPNYFNQEHINYFTVKTLDYFCARNGLQRCSPEKECYHVMCPAFPEMAISVVYRKSGNVVFEMERDDSGERSAELYFSKIDQKHQWQKNLVKDLLKEESKLIIWGTGAFASSFIKEIPELLNQVICFVDNDVRKQENTFFGKTVISPKELKRYQEVPIVVCVMIDSQRIKEQMETLNLSNSTLFLCNAKDED